MINDQSYDVAEVDDFEDDHGVDDDQAIDNDIKIISDKSYDDAKVDDFLKLY